MQPSIKQIIHLGCNIHTVTVKGEVHETAKIPASHRKALPVQYGGEKVGGGDGR